MDVSSAAPTTTTPAPAASTPAAPISTDAAPTPTPAAPSAFDWKSLNLAPELQNVVDRHQFADPAMVVKSYGEFEKLHGVPVDRLLKLPSPKEAADPKAWDAIYTKLGRPETADKYVIPVPEGDKGEFAATVKPWLHEAGLSQSQATKLAEKWNGHFASVQAAQTAAIEQRNTADVAALKQGWGAEYETRATLVDKAADVFGMTQDQLTALKDSLGPKAAMEFLFNIGSRLGVEDGTVPGINAPHTFQFTPEQAQAEIARLKTDRDFVQLFNSPDAKARMEARKEMDRLHKLAYPGSTPVPAGVVRQARA